MLYIIRNRLFQTINRFLLLERKRIYEQDGVRLFPSEIHLLVFLHRKGFKNATRFAEEFGLTKGAVSQTISRLQRKGTLTKKKDPFAKNEMSLEMTPLGRKIIKTFLEKQSKEFANFNAYLQTLDEAEQKVILNFLGAVERWSRR